jgi:hypothetical protein
VAPRRRAWFDSQLDLDPERLIFIDKAAVTRAMGQLGDGSSTGATSARSWFSPSAGWSSAGSSRARRLTHSRETGQSVET